MISVIIYPESKLLKLKSKHLTEILILEGQILDDRATKKDYGRLLQLNMFIARIEENLELIRLENKQKRFHLN
jgi:hypothetical protein